MRYLSISLLVLVFGCGDSSTSTSPTPTAPPPVMAAPFQITGHVSQFAVAPTGSGRFANVNYEVTIVASRATTGCFIEVKWLNETGLQVGRDFVAADVAVPEGESLWTGQGFETIDISNSIRDSRVTFDLCR